MGKKLTIWQPPIDVLFSYNAPQPFVPLYIALLSEGGHIVMNVLSVVALWLVCFLLLLNSLKPKRKPLSS